VSRVQADFTAGQVSQPTDWKEEGDEAKAKEFRGENGPRKGSVGGSGKDCDKTEGSKEIGREVEMGCKGVSKGCTRKKEGRHFASFEA